MIIDAHAHLVFENLDVDRIVANMQKDKIEKIVSIGTNVEDCEKTVKLAEKYKDVYATIGIHPEFADLYEEGDLKIIEELAKHEKVVAIGEIGLDYHYTKENVDKQKELFVKQIKLAKKLNLPICVHTRDAKEDTYKILKEYKDYIVVPSVMHCFCEDGEYAQKFLDLGFYISFAGNATFKKYDRSFIKDIPIDKILVETDSPFLTPEPYRGRSNEPANTHLTAEKIACEYEMDDEKFKNITVENTYRVYKKMKR